MDSCRRRTCPQYPQHGDDGDPLPSGPSTRSEGHNKHSLNWYILWGKLPTSTGLLLVALAGDTDSRRFWFAHPHRSLHARATFVMLVLPGFISIAALIPPLSDEWYYVSGVLGLVCALAGLSLGVRDRRAQEHNRKPVGCGIRTGTFVLLSCLFAIVPVLKYTGFSAAELVLGAIVWVTIFAGTVSVASLLLHESREEEQRARRRPKPVPSETGQPEFGDGHSGILWILISVAFLLGLVLGLKKNHRDSYTNEEAT